MRKPIPLLSLILLLAIALSACGSLTPPPAATVSQPTAIVEQTAPAESQAAEPTTASTPSTPECRVDTSSQSNLEMEKLFPTVGTTEWSKGPANAYVHIIEYSDFQ
jgi:predicted small lipoprotein YifL